MSGSSHTGSGATSPGATSPRATSPAKAVPDQPLLMPGLWTEEERLLCNLTSSLSMSDSSHTGSGATSPRAMSPTKAVRKKIWTKEERRLFEMGIAKYPGHWGKISAEFVTSRTPLKVREYAQARERRLLKEKRKMIERKWGNGVDVGGGM